jgi:hypothetical protein
VVVHAATRRGSGQPEDFSIKAWCGKSSQVKKGKKKGTSKKKKKN